MATADQDHETLRARVRQQEVVADLGQRALETTDVASLFEAATEAVAETLDAEYCKVLDLQPDGETLALRAGVGWDDGLVGAASVPADRDSQAGYTLAREEAVVVEDLEAETRFSGPDLLTDHDVRSGVSVVIGAVDDPWGILGVHATEARTFTDHDANFVTSVANVLGSAVENAETRRRLGTQRTLTERIVETSPVGILRLSAEGAVEFANERATEILGRDRETIESMTDADAEWGLVDAAGDPLARDEVPTRQAIESGESIFDVEIGVERPDGELVWLSVNAKPLWDDGRVEGAILTLEDVTDRRHLGRRLERKNRTLQRLHAITADPERSFETKVEDLLDLGQGFLGLDVGVLARVDEAADEFEVVAATGEDDRLTPGTTAPLDDGYVGHTLDADGPVAFHDASGALDADAVDRWGFDAYVGATVTAGDAPFGTICLYGDEPREREFSPGERAYVELVGQWLGQELDRRERRRTLERYREYTNDVLDAVDDVFYVVDGDGRVQRWNESLESVTGYDEATIESMRALEFFDEADRERIADTMLAGFDRDTARVEAPLVTADGEVIPYEFVASPLETPEGEHVLAGIGRDVTERKERERELAKYETIVETVNDGIYAVDEDGRFTMVNERYVELTGYGREELLGADVSLVVDEATSERASELTREMREDADEQPTLEAELHTADGDRVPTEATFALLETDDGDVERIGVVRDVTERERARKRRERLVAELEESNERLEQFAYAASHDLQEPLRMISSYLGLIESRYGDRLDDDAEEFLDFAVDGADRMREMIDGLLQYSRIDTRGTPLEPVDLDDVVDGVLDDLGVILAEADAEVTVDALPTVRGDAAQLRQLFQNLLSNAVKYAGNDPPHVHVTATPPGEPPASTPGDWTVSTPPGETGASAPPGETSASTSSGATGASSPDGATVPPAGDAPAGTDRWTVSVSDEGIGLEQDDAERIFEVFNRLHGREEYEGTGIGLALCERIVERHGGEIWVDGEPGEGTTVSFTLEGVDDD